MAYQIIDELETTQKKTVKPVWSPTVLFFVTMFSTPLGLIAYAINWGRLGFPDKRLHAYAVAALYVLALAGLFYAVNFQRIPLGRRDVMTVLTLGGIILGYWQLFTQRAPYDIHLSHGGKNAGCLFTGLLLFLGFALWILRSFIRLGW
jgi:hypothetical protein